jgi:adenosine deaminase
VLGMQRERRVVLEVCPTSNLTTRVVRNAAEMRFILRSLIDHEVPFTLSTDGPEMLRTHLRDELALMLRSEMMTLDEVRRAIETAHAASFLDDGTAQVDGSLDGPSAADGHAPIALEIEV